METGKQSESNLRYFGLKSFKNKPQYCRIKGRYLYVRP